VWTSTLLRPDGTEREITWSNMSFEIDGARHGAAIFRDATEARQASRNAAALGQAAAQLAGRSPLNVVLWDLAEHAVAGTRAVGCAIDITGEAGDFETGAPPGVSDGFRNLSLSSGLRIEDLPDGGVVLSGRPAVVPDAKARWLTGPRPDVGATLQELDWQAGVHIPLSWGEQVLGVMAVFLPPMVTGPTEAELAFLVALADQGAVAVINDRLLEETGQTSALQERARLARELHDSVSQALFSMTLHARTAQLAMEKQNLPEDGPLGRSVAQLRELSQGALAEMRALIFELRPDALAEEGLVAAVAKQAAALSARAGLPIRIDAPANRLELAPAVEEHLYRLVLEALNNTIKHAQARLAEVLISDADGRLTITASDDGIGFDPTEGRPGHMGMGTMRDRAEAIGADLRVESAGHGQGTTITVTLDRDR
jgi:signal transduction histidine kinase